MRCAPWASTAIGGWRPSYWNNNAEHLGAYLAIPSMGCGPAHPQHPALPRATTYIAEHADDKVVSSTTPSCRCSPSCSRRSRPSSTYLVAGPEAGAADLDSLRTSRQAGAPLRDLLAAADPDLRLGGCRRDDAAAMCYTSGTTVPARAWSTRTARHTALDDPCARATSANHLARPGAADRPDVPRQRLGPAVCRVAGGPRRSSCPTVGTRPSRSRALHGRLAPTVSEPCRRSGTTCWATSTIVSAGHTGGPLVAPARPVAVDRPSRWSLQKALKRRRHRERSAWG